MAEHLIIEGNSKEERYATLFPQLQSHAEGESDLIANMANVAACIKDGEVIAVLDIDSEFLGTFDAIDKEWLEKAARLFA